MIGSVKLALTLELQLASRILLHLAWKRAGVPECRFAIEDSVAADPSVLSLVRDLSRFRETNAARGRHVVEVERHELPRRQSSVDPELAIRPRKIGPFVANGTESSNRPPLMMNLIATGDDVLWRVPELFGRI